MQVATSYLIWALDSSMMFKQCLDRSSVAWFSWRWALWARQTLPARRQEVTGNKMVGSRAFKSFKCIQVLYISLCMPWNPSVHILTCGWETLCSSLAPNLIGNMDTFSSLASTWPLDSLSTFCSTLKYPGHWGSGALLGGYTAVLATEKMQPSGQLIRSEHRLT